MPRCPIAAPVALWPWPHMQRGHMVPAADMAADSLAWRQSFRTPNIAPQSPALNQGAWSQIEELSRQWARQSGGLVAIAGPLWPNDTATLPSSYWKVLINYRSQPMQAIAWVMPNGATPQALSHYATTIANVQQLTGHQLLVTLPTATRQALINQCNPAQWFAP